MTLHDNTRLVLIDFMLKRKRFDVYQRRFIIRWCMLKIEKDLLMHANEKWIIIDINKGKC